MVAVLGLEHFTDLVHLEREGCAIEVSVHLAGSYEAEVALGHDRVTVTILRSEVTKQ